MADWQVAPLQALSPRDVFDFLELRSIIFVVEQDCVYQDPGHEDRHPETLHMLLRDGGGSLIAYARLLPPGLDGKEPAIGRVVCAAEHRGRGLGHDLMDRAVECIESVWPGHSIRLHGQTHLQDFYAEHGFAAVAASYLLDGIPHVDMLRPVPFLPDNQKEKTP